MESLDQSLFHFMSSSHFRPLHLADIRYITQQLLEALKELSKFKLVHGDLKPDNIMLVDHKREPFKIKLIDFGISMDVRALIPGSVIQAIGCRPQKWFWEHR
ncbi:hypothetical protein WMY93_007616 [Mugilogobius chulae]|uniref:Protein kinase domain-containing protein n=1 Tax=Mugilogobius chulae TaxID=88201 RepID=A0AAW0PDP1_9GOBI